MIVEAITNIQAQLANFARVTVAVLLFVKGIVGFSIYLICYEQINLVMDVRAVHDEMLECHSSVLQNTVARDLKAKQGQCPLLPAR